MYFLSVIVVVDIKNEVISARLPSKVESVSAELTACVPMRFASVPVDLSSVVYLPRESVSGR